MGWNTCALFVEGQSIPTALQLLANSDDESVPVAGSDARATVDAATATSSFPSSEHGGTFYAADAHGWTQVWDPEGISVLGLGDPLPDLEASSRKVVLAAIFGSVTSTYGFMLFRAGGLVRQAIYADGQLVAHEGEPLPVEKEITVPEWGPDEDFVWAVIKAVTGIQYDEALRFTVYHTPAHDSADQWGKERR